MAASAQWIRMAERIVEAERYADATRISSWYRFQRFVFGKQRFPDESELTQIAYSRITLVPWG